MRLFVFFKLRAQWPYLDFKARHMNKNVLLFFVCKVSCLVCLPFVFIFIFNIFGSEYIRGLPIFNYLISSNC